VCVDVCVLVFMSVRNRRVYPVFRGVDSATLLKQTKSLFQVKKETFSSERTVVLV